MLKRSEISQRNGSVQTGSGNGKQMAGFVLNLPAAGRRTESRRDLFLAACDHCDLKSQSQRCPKIQIDVPRVHDSQEVGVRVSAQNV